MGVNYKVVFSAACEKDLLELNAYIAGERSAAVADRFVDSIISYCEGLARFPMRGKERDDLCSGLRVVGFKRKASISFLVDGNQVVVVGVFYRGRDLGRPGQLKEVAQENLKKSVLRKREKQ